MKKFLSLIGVVLVCLLGYTDAFSQKKYAFTHNEYKEGTASFYSNKFNGRKTATGEIFQNSNYTAASNFFKLGTYVKVTNLSNGRYVYLKINDRMGHQSRVIDVTYLAAKDLRFINSGTTKVKIEEVHPDEGKRRILAQQDNKVNDTPEGNTL